MKKKFLIAMFKHETNTFSPVVTDVQRFKNWGLYEDEAVITAYKNTNHPLAAFLDIAEREGAEIVTPVAAEAMPSGLVTKEAFEYISGKILKALDEHEFDAAFLDLHGAMVSEGTDDGDRALILKIREKAPNLPLCITFDMHGNMSDDVMKAATIVNCYKSYPHTDMYQTGLAAGNLMIKALKGEIKPTLSWGYAPILAQTLKMGTADEPMKTLQNMTRQQEAEGILLSSVFGGFPMADIPAAGLSAVVITDNDPQKAKAARDELLNYAWEKRAELIYTHEPLKLAVKRAKAINVSPVILLDHADNVGSGGTSDDMTVIKEVLKQNLDGVAVATVYDPEAAKFCQQAGEGAYITLDLGGNSDMPSLQLKGKPLNVSGKVLSVKNGTWKVEGPMYTGATVHTGLTAVLQVEGVKIVITSLHHEPWDKGIFTNNGINPEEQRFLLLKSRIHYRAGFERLAKATVTLDGQGVTTSNNTELTYTRLTRPLYPFDKDMAWEAN